MAQDSDGFEERLARSGFEGLTDAEALELLLLRSVRGDRTGAAVTLIHRFGSLPAVLAAGPAALRQCVSAAAARDLALVYAAARRLASAELPRRRPISSWSALTAYLRLEMAYLPREAFRVLFLDRKNQLIADEVMGEGTVEKHRTYGTGPVYRKIGGRVVYVLSELEAWAEQGRASSTSDPGHGRVPPAKRHAALSPAYRRP